MLDVLRCDVFEVVGHELNACVRGSIWFEHVTRGEAEATEETFRTSGLQKMLSVRQERRDEGHPPLQGLSLRHHM